MNKLRNLYLLLLVSLTLSCMNAQNKKQNSSDNSVEWWHKEVSSMIENQILARGVTDKRVLDAIRKTPRHEFVPQRLKSKAYDDRPLPIGYDQTISQPYIVALMTDLLELEGDEKVLEIGTGSGYQAAILSKLADKCYSIEIVEELAKSARVKLKKQGCDNVVVKHGDGYKGWVEHAPYDRIIITAAPPEIPEKLIDQLKIGGIMVVPVGNIAQQLMKITKTESGLKRKSITPVRFVPMVHPK